MRAFAETQAEQERLIRQRRGLAQLLVRLCTLLDAECVTPVPNCCLHELYAHVWLRRPGCSGGSSSGCCTCTFKRSVRQSAISTSSLCQVHRACQQQQALLVDPMPTLLILLKCCQARVLRRS